MKSITPSKSQSHVITVSMNTTLNKEISNSCSKYISEVGSF